MRISMPKTYTQHVHRREKLKTAAAEAAVAQRKFGNKCEYCERCFKTSRALNIHKASCMYVYEATEEYYEVEDIIGVFGRRENRWYLVKWRGYDDPSWQREHLLKTDGCNDSIRDFWLRSELSPSAAYYPDPEGKNRCEICCKTYARPQDLKAHVTRTGHDSDKVFAASKAAISAVRLDKRKEQQQQLPKVHWTDVPWDDEPADNCWRFKYLGSLFDADGDQMPDVLTRIAMATARFGKMRHLWKNNSLHRNLRL